MAWFHVAAAVFVVDAACCPPTPCLSINFEEPRVTVPKSVTRLVCQFVNEERDRHTQTDTETHTATETVTETATGKDTPTATGTDTQAQTHSHGHRHTDTEKETDTPHRDEKKPISTHTC